MDIQHKKQLFKKKILPVSNKLMQFASAILKNEEEAKDAVQEVYIKLWNKFPQESEILNPEAFAMQVLKNHCLDRIKAKHTFSIDENDNRLTETDNDTPYTQMADGETKKIIEQLIDALPALQRMVIQLRDIQQYTTDETGEVLQMDPNAVRVNLSRARKTLRKNFKIQQQYEQRRIQSASGKIL